MSWASTAPAAGPLSTRRCGKFLTGLEHAEAQRLAREAGLTRLDRREKLFRWLECWYEIVGANSVFALLLTAH